MCGNTPHKLKPQDIGGLKYLESVLPLLERLRDSGTERDRSGNRRLHFDQYAALVLLGLFNPALRSLRSLQQASELKKVQKLIGGPRASLGSLSEAQSVFDPDLLVQVAAELAAQVGSLPRARTLPDVGRILTAVDGSLQCTLPKMVEAAYGKSRNGKTQYGWRLHTHFEIDRHIPTSLTVTGGANSGEADERRVLKKQLQSGRCYLMDRGFQDYDLLDAIVEAGGSYVARLRSNTVYEILEERPLTPEAIQAGVARDLIVRLGAGDKQVGHKVRLVLVRSEPHPKRSGPGRREDDIIVLATDMLDAPAEVVADLFRHRWTIELFFRFFKQTLGCEHLLAHTPEGVAIQTWCAIIACLLLRLWTGRKPKLRTLEMFCHYYSGLADEEELLAHLEKLKTAPLD